MQRTISFFFLSVISLGCFAQFSISSNKRYLLQDGKPFFWLADTGWELFHRLNREEADRYLRTRSEQGFTVVQAVVLAELDGLHAPNANGDLPLLNDNPATPNEKYFEHVDYIVDKAASYHIAIAMLPTWGDKVYKHRWGIGPEIFTENTAAVYGQWIANRYKNRKNIIWVLGGDRLPRNDSDVAIWRSMGKAIMKATGDKAIISYHPQPTPLGSAQWFHQDEWFSFNMFQTGHCRNSDVYDLIQKVYNMQPARPVIDAEPIYEDHPVCFNAKDLGTSNAHDVRRAAYLALFAGAFGHTYGCHDVWQMYASKHKPVNGPHLSWNDALELPGAAQMKFVRNLMEAFPMIERVPDQSLVIEGNYVPAERVQATRGTNYLFVYTTAGKPFTVVMGKIKGKLLKGYWYDPRTGKKIFIDAVGNTGNKLFKPSSSGYGQDWVLVLYDAEGGYENKTG